MPPSFPPSQKAARSESEHLVWVVGLLAWLLVALVVDGVVLVLLLVVVVWLAVLRYLSAKFQYDIATERVSHLVQWVVLAGALVVDTDVSFGVQWVGVTCLRSR